MFVYFVMQRTAIHTKCCTSFNSQYEHIRVHVCGVWLSKDAAKAEAKNRERATGQTHYVQGYKIRDCVTSFMLIPGQYIPQPPPKEYLDPCAHCKGSPCGNAFCPKLRKVT